jgi:flagellar biosynthesis/type III secretory pathway chaperone
MDNATLRQQVSSLLRDEQRLLLQLETLLRQETEVLRGDDSAAIEQVGATRQECVDALSKLARERDDLAGMLGAAAGERTFVQLLKRCDSDGTLARQWQTNLQQARKLRDLNERNGALVAVKLNHVQGLLTALRGGTARGDYGPAATFPSSFSGKELGIA